MNICYKLSSFLKGNMKMHDIDPYHENNKTDKQPDTDEMISLTPGGVIAGERSWKPVSEQEASFRGGKIQSTRLKEEFVQGLYYREKSAPLTTKQDKLRSVGVITEPLAKEGLKVRF